MITVIEIRTHEYGHSFLRLSSRCSVVSVRSVLLQKRIGSGGRRIDEKIEYGGQIICYTVSGGWSWCCCTNLLGVS